MSAIKTDDLEAALALLDEQPLVTVQIDAVIIDAAKAHLAAMRKQPVTREFDKWFLKFLFFKETERLGKNAETGKYEWAPAPDITGYHVIRTWLSDTSRWNNIFTGIFQIPDGTFWEVTWSEGATEDQDAEAWDYEKIVTAAQVKLQHRDVLIAEPVVA